MNYWAA